MRRSTRPGLRVAARMALGACGAGLGLVCGASLTAHAADDTPWADGLVVLPLRDSGKGDKLSPPQPVEERTVVGQTPTSQTAHVEPIPVDTVMAHPVAKETEQTPAAQTTQPKTAAIGSDSSLPASAMQKSQPEPAKAKAAPADEGVGEIQWSTNKTASAGGIGAAVGGLNPSGRAVELTVPLRDGTFYLGDVSARIAPGDAVSVPKDRLVQVLTPLLRPASLEALKKLPDTDGYLSLAAVKSAGYDMQFDPGKVEMQVNPSIDQRVTGNLSARNGREQVLSENLSRPAILAGYLNMRAGADYSTQSFYGDEGTANARVGFDGAARWHDVVFESAATLEAEGGLSRGSSRFVYDMPEEALRFSAGDVTPGKSLFQGGSDLLGVSVEKSYQKLQPAASIHPTGSQSFRIERPSNVDVVINSHVAQRLHLRPGDYDMNDLPLSAGANDIELVIEDDLGNKRTLKFSVFSGRSLLAPGISEWSLSAGVASHYDTSGFKDFHNLYSGLEYDYSTPVLTGYYQRGLTPDLTGTVHLQADPDVVMGGAGAAFQTSFGFWGTDAALSNSLDHGLGYALNIAYELANLEGKDGIRRSFRLAADYRSENFTTVSVLDPRNETMLGLSAMYSQELPWNLSGSISGTYSLGRGAYDDHYVVDLALGRSFGPDWSVGVGVGYGQSLGTQNETLLNDGFIAAVRVNHRLDQNSSIDAAYDGRTGQSQLSYRHQEGSGVGSWNAQAELDRTPTSSGGDDTGQLGLNGSFGYTANRAEVSVSQHTGLAGLDTRTVDQRTSVTAGTAIAFADGQVAVGRPVSSGFAIIDTHSSLPDSEVTVGSNESKRASSDWLGPALLPDMSAYSPARVAIDVSNLPAGYDLGAGGFDLYPGYKSGYALTVGSDYTITAFGTLQDNEGQPVALITGTAYEEGSENGRKVTIFTNRTGRFGAQGLRPGRWVVDMATEPAKTRFIIDIPKDTVGLLKLDTLKPVGTVP